MYKAMKTLIGKKFYASAEIAQAKLDVFYAANRLTDEAYIELTAMVAKAVPACLFGLLHRTSGRNLGTAVPAGDCEFSEGVHGYRGRGL